MTTNYSRGVGQYRASEVHNFVFNRTYPANGTRRGIIIAHGANHTADSDLHTAGNLTNYIIKFADAGYPVMVADLSATTYAGNNWGNDDFIASMTAAWTFLQSPGGAKTDKVGIFGSSMGGLAANWIRQNLSSVFAFGAVIPVLDPVDVYTNNKGAFQSSIGTAYGVTFPSALPNQSTHCPVSFGSTDLLNIPTRLWTSFNDPIASNTTSATSWAGKGASPFTVTDMGSIGHDSTQVDPAQLLDWFDAQGGRS